MADLDPNLDPKVVKVVFVGEAGVGKTCIINSAVRHTFNQDSRSTVGTGFEKLTIGEGSSRIVFEIWDTAGQELYRALTPRFFKQAGVAIFVFDLTSLNSLRSLTYYFEKLRQICPDGSVIISVVGNKTDLETKRSVKLEDVLEAKKCLSARFYRECSAKLGAGVIEIFEDVASCRDLVTNVCSGIINVDFPVQEQKSCNC
jgi:small GTP-binding protein